MRRERPQDVFLAPHLPEIEPVRIEVLQSSERPLAHQLAQLDEGRVVLQQVADHQPPVALLGQRRTAARPRRRRAPVASRQRRACRRRARCAPGRRAAPPAPRSRPRRSRRRASTAAEFEQRRAHSARRAARRPLHQGRRSPQRAQLGKVADQVLAPIAAADHRHPRRASALRPSRICCQRTSLPSMLPQSG